MKITLSVSGRLHAFEVARILNQRNALAHLMTTYPKFAVTPHGIPKERILSSPWLEIGRRAWGRVPVLSERWNSQYYFSHAFDLWAAKQLTADADVFIGWSGNSISAIRRAKALGMVATVDRGSSHMLTQQQLLNEEYERFGLRFSQTHPKIIEQELQEYAEADVIQVPSLFALRTFHQHGIAEKKLLHLPYGFVPGAFKTTTAKDKPFRLIYCGNLSLQKGLVYLLDAFTELKLKDAELWVFGALNPEMSAAKINLDRPNVKYFGKQPWNVLADHFSRGTVFCLPSVQDGFAIVLLQAMACGLPVIGTENSGTPDAVTNGQEGFIVPIRNVERLKESILWCYQNRAQCDQMGKLAQQRVQAQFGWNHYADRMLAYYQSRLT